jgi:hypothetical protein
MNYLNIFIKTMCIGYLYIAFPQSSGLYGETGGPDYLGIQTTEGKLHGTGNIQNIITKC